MQLSYFIYLVTLPIDITFEEYLCIISKLESTNLQDPVSLDTINTLVDAKDAKILYNYINIIGNSVITLLLVLFNQLQTVYYKTRNRNCSIQDKYTLALEFFKSQIREFVCCVSLLKDPEYLKVKDASELKVDTILFQEILDLLTVKRRVNNDVVLLKDIEQIMEQIEISPNFDQSVQFIHGKSKNLVVLESSELLIISSCLDCTIYLLGVVDSLYMDNCSNVTVYMSACGIANVDHVHMCSIKGVFKQVWIQNSVKSSLALYTEKESIISNCSDLVISPIDFCWNGHLDDLELLNIQVGSEGKWDKWISKNCRKISIIDPQDFSSIILPFTRDSESQKTCCLQLPQNYKQTFEMQEALLSSLRDFINVQSHLYPNFLKDVETSVSEWLKNSNLTEEYIKLSQEMP